MVSKYKIYYIYIYIIYSRTPVSAGEQTLYAVVTNGWVAYTLFLEFSIQFFDTADMGVLLSIKILTLKSVYKIIQSINR